MKEERIKAVITLFVTVVANTLNVFGYAMDAGLAYNFIFGIVACLSVVYCWWKNQNITEAAALAQEYLESIRGR